MARMVPLIPVLKDLAVGAALPVLDAFGLLDFLPNIRLFAQMRLLARSAGETKGTLATRKKILFMSLKGAWVNHLAWEYSLAAALQIRGAECTFLLCDKALPKCDVKLHNNSFRTRCLACHAYSRTFAKYLGMPALWLSQFLSEEEEQRLRKTAFSIPYEELERIKFDGLDVQHTIKPSLVRYFRRGSLDGSEHTKQIHREFFYAGLTAATALKKILASVRPDAVITVNGKFFAENILFQLCRREGIDIYTYERGKIKDTLNIVHNDISVDWDNTRAWEAVSGRDLSPQEKSTIENYISDRKRGLKTVLHFHPNPQEDELLIKRQAGFREGKKHFVLFTNLVWDSAVQYKDTIFANMFEWIRETIVFFADHPDANLIVRIHPAEVKIASDVTEERTGDYLKNAFAKMPPNVCVVSPESDISSYRLIELSDGVLVYTSTVGIEAALERKPVVVAGLTHYSGKGFTLDPGSREEYFNVLRGLVVDGRVAALDWASAWKYAYVFFFKAMTAFPWVSERRIGVVDGISFQSSSELVPGKSRALDVLCDDILSGNDVTIE
ncbi:MAG: hypothetical protein V2A74_05575 [bacterium]